MGEFVYENGCEQGERTDDCACPVLGGTPTAEFSLEERGDRPGDEEECDQPRGVDSDRDAADPANFY